MKEIKTTMYEAIDGALFKDPVDCSSHERGLVSVADSMIEQQKDFMFLHLEDDSAWKMCGIHYFVQAFNMAGIEQLNTIFLYKKIYDQNYTYDGSYVHITPIDANINQMYYLVADDSGYHYRLYKCDEFIQSFQTLMFDIDQARIKYENSLGGETNEEQ